MVGRSPIGLQAVLSHKGTGFGARLFSGSIQELSVYSSGLCGH